MNGFGSSEFAHICSGIIIPEDCDTGPVPAGLPLPGIDVRTFDEVGREVRNGMTGEVTIRCPAMSAGHWRRPDLSRSVFGVDDPATGASFYRTDDVGRFGDDVRLLVLGRADSQIRIRGHRLLAEQVEVILAAHPDIAAALQTFARARLPNCIVPTCVLVQTSLPMTTAGKLDRPALGRLATQR